MPDRAEDRDACAERAELEIAFPRVEGFRVDLPSENLRAAFAASEASGLADQVTVSVMHLAKGLEFRAIAVMACDQDVLPLESRIAEAAGESELDDIYETERQLLYVAPAPETATAYW